MSDDKPQSEGFGASDPTELFSEPEASSSSPEDETLLEPSGPDGEADATELPTLDGSSLAQHSEPAVPQSIGRYTVLGKLGEGGMGLVYLAEQKNPKRQVALKVVRGGQFVDEMTVKMFEREAETLGRLKHSNIGAIYESGRTDDGQHFFAMELVEGETLDRHLAKTPGPVSPEELERRLGLFQQIADAVHYAHQRGVIHRDLKPANIVVTDSEKESAVKILDFGLARLTESDTAATTTTEVGMIKGTLPYMSPEQAVGQSEEIDVRTDVYALGVILYEMLTGQRPYDTTTSLVDAIRVICEKQPTPLKQVWQGTRKLDPDIETIIGKALEKDADRRYASAAGFSEDVGRFLGSLPILARPPSTTYQLKKLVGRNKLATAFAAIQLVLLLGFGIWMSVLWRQTDVALQKAEASRLLALGRLEADESSASALAFALASLEIADDPAARVFAIENLQKSPMPHIVASGPSTAPSFSPDGNLLSLGVYEGATELRLVDGSDGSRRVLESASIPSVLTDFDSSGEYVLSKRMGSSEVKVWSVANGELVRTIDVGLEGIARWSGDREILTFVESEDVADPVDKDGDLRPLSEFSIESWPLEGSEKEIRGIVQGQVSFEITVQLAIDPIRGRLAYSRDDKVYLNELEAAAKEVLVGIHPGALYHAFRPGSDEVASASVDGEIRLWSTAEGRETEARVFAASSNSATPLFSPDGSLLAAGGQDGTISLWNLEAPPGAAPIELQKRDRRAVWHLSFHPSGNWLAAADNGAAAIWSLGRPSAIVLPGQAGPVDSVTFDPFGRWLAASSAGADETVFWPLEADAVAPEPLGGARDSDISPDGELFLSDLGGLSNLETGERVEIRVANPWSAAFSPDGRYAAAAGGQFVEEGTVIRLLDLESLEIRELDPGDGEWISGILFTQDGRLIASGSSGIRVWDLETGEAEILSEEATSYLALTADDRTLLTLGINAGKSRGDALWLRDLISGAVRQLTSHGESVMHLAVDPEGDFVVTADTEGVVRVGPLSGEEPHLLLGHTGLIHSVAIDPKKRWIASGGIDGTVRLWPIPEGQPFQTLPLPELVERLRRLTNYRVVPDVTEKLGFRVDVEPFAGWKQPIE